MSAVDDLLRHARSTVDRVTPTAAAQLHAQGALIADIRPYANRSAEGEIPGSVPIERIHLEWRLDPAGEHRLPTVTTETIVIVVCNEGYASSFAAAALHQLGLSGAADLIGGFRAWAAEGLPVRPGGTPAVR